MKPISENIIQFFIDTDNNEIAIIISNVNYDITVKGVNDVFGISNYFILRIKGNTKVCKALSHLPEYEKNRIIKAIQKNDDSISQSIDDIEFIDDKVQKIPPKTELICNLLILKSLLINIATGKDLIQDKNDDFIIIRKQTENLLNRFEIDFSIRFNDLWEWFKYYKEHFSTYQDRREFVNSKFKTILKSLAQLPEKSRKEIPLTGWDRVDRVLSKANDSYDLAKNEEDFQQIGLLCREVFITLGQVLFNSSTHKMIDDVNPSKTDAKRLLEIYIENEVVSKSKSTLRKYLRSAIDLSLDLQHRRTANKTDAAICLEATFSVTNTIRIIKNKNKITYSNI